MRKVALQLALGTLCLVAVRVETTSAYCGVEGCRCAISIESCPVRKRTFGFTETRWAKWPTLAQADGAGAAEELPTTAPPDRKHELRVRPERDEAVDAVPESTQMPAEPKPFTIPRGDDDVPPPPLQMESSAPDNATTAEEPRSGFDLEPMAPAEDTNTPRPPPNRVPDPIPASPDSGPLDFGFDNDLQPSPPAGPAPPANAVDPAPEPTPPETKPEGADDFDFLDEFGSMQIPSRSSLAAAQTLSQADWHGVPAGKRVPQVQLAAALEASNVPEARTETPLQAPNGVADGVANPLRIELVAHRSEPPATRPQPRLTNPLRTSR